MELQNEIEDEIKRMHEDGQSKDAIADYLITEHQIPFTKINKVIKDAGLKFGRQKGDLTWKLLAANAFATNPELTKEGMAEAIKDAVKDPDYYVKAFHQAFSILAIKLSTS